MTGRRDTERSGPVIEVTDVDFGYNGQLVLEGVNLTIQAGDFVALLGPNGGGKTTLVKILAGILKPNRGRVRVLGRRPDRSGGLVGYVPQDIHLQRGFPITALEVVLMGLVSSRRRGWRWSGDDQAAARRALDRVGMGDYADRSIDRLSLGQRQRVFIARALVDRAEVLILDEPVASVDAGWQSNLFNLLKELNQRVTVIVVSHDLSVMSAYVKSVACINRTLFHHPADEVTAEAIQATYQCPVELIAHGLPHRVLAEHHHHHGEGDDA